MCLRVGYFLHTGAILIRGRELHFSHTRLSKVGGWRREMMPAINSGHLSATPDLTLTLTSRPWPPPSQNNSQVLIPKRVDLRLTEALAYIIVCLIRVHF